MKIPEIPFTPEQLDKIQRFLRAYKALCLEHNMVIEFHPGDEEERGFAALKPMYEPMLPFHELEFEPL
jgi:hypothetical protein